jgi:hypothetical protein
LEKLACAQTESSTPVAEKLSETPSDVVDDDGSGDGADPVCPAIYTGNLGWLPLLILMVYIFFFNLVRSLFNLGPVL